MSDFWATFGKTYALRKQKTTAEIKKSIANAVSEFSEDDCEYLMDWAEDQFIEARNDEKRDMIREYYKGQPSRMREDIIGSTGLWGEAVTLAMTLDQYDMNKKLSLPAIVKSSPDDAKYIAAYVEVLRRQRNLSSEETGVHVVLPMLLELKWDKNLALIIVSFYSRW